MARFAWVLNLDAELELAQPTYVPSRKLSAQLGEYAALARALLGPADVTIDASSRGFTGYVGRAWCPTPRALAVMKRAGVEPEPHPSAAVLRAANHRQLSFELGGGPPGSQWVRSESEIGELVAEGGDWLCKRPLSFAGRGQLYLRAPITEPQRAWIAASLSRDGLLVEPRVVITLEIALHGIVTRAGEYELGRPCVQLVGTGGVWKGTRLAGPDEIGPSERAALETSGVRVARALAEIGYFGPFNVDGYRYVAARAQAFCALGEVNARFSMGFATGFPRPAHALSFA